MTGYFVINTLNKINFFIKNTCIYLIRKRYIVLSLTAVTHLKITKQTQINSEISSWLIRVLRYDVHSLFDNNKYNMFSSCVMILKKWKRDGEKLNRSYCNYTCIDNLITCLDPRHSLFIHESRHVNVYDNVTLTYFISSVSLTLT